MNKKDHNTIVMSQHVDKLLEKDLGQLRELQPPGWSDIEPSFLDYLRKPFGIPVQVSEGSEILGIGAGIHFGKTGWLGHIIVKPSARRRGIGSVIVTHLLKELGELGCESISLIATDLGAPLYAKLGFIEVTTYLFFEGSETRNKAQEISPRIVPFHHARRDELLQLDRSISGEQREPLLTDVLDTSYLYLSNGRLAGFYLPDLGEGLIIADENEAGIELMKLRHKAKHRTVVPVENRGAIEFLTQSGFRQVNAAARMIWGKPFRWQPQGLYGRIGGNLG